MSATMSKPIRVTDQTSEAITLAQARKQLEIAQSDLAHDDQLTLLIQSARDQWEADTDSAVLTQTWRVYLDSFNDDEIYLPKRPVSSITTLKYYDLTNTQQTLATSYYSLDQGSRVIRLKYQQDWPGTVARWDAVEITYVCGYASAAAVPAIAKQAMLLLVGKYFENRDLLVNDVIFTDAAYESLVRKFMRSCYP
jgi:uncharacterized phiE125 gp8 family phage protein